jgi:hypothetical protein
MFSRMKSMATAALIAAASCVGAVRNWARKSSNDVHVHVSPRTGWCAGGWHGLRRGQESSGTVAQAKRAAVKKKNRQRNKRAHRG